MGTKFQKPQKWKFCLSNLNVESLCKPRVEPNDWAARAEANSFAFCRQSSRNSNFNYGEFATIRNQSGLNSFKISVKEFVARTGAISLQAKAGRYGGTYAHKDIAFEFAMWISPEFKVYSLPFACTKWSLLWKAGYGYQITKHPCSK